jgi:hypothetical protein
VIHGCGHTFFFFFFPQRGHIDWPIFWNIGHSPIETPLWTPIAKFRKLFVYKYPPFSLFTWELNFGLVDPFSFHGLSKEEKKIAVATCLLSYVWFILITSWVWSHFFLFFFLFWRGHIDWPIFLEHWALPYRNTSLDPSHKIKINILHFLSTFSVDVHGSWTGANHMR